MLNEIESEIERSLIEVGKISFIDESMIFFLFFFNLHIDYKKRYAQERFFFLFFSFLF